VFLCGLLVGIVGGFSFEGRHLTNHIRGRGGVANRISRLAGGPVLRHTRSGGTGGALRLSMEKKKKGKTGGKGGQGLFQGVQRGQTGCELTLISGSKDTGLGQSGKRDGLGWGRPKKTRRKVYRRTRLGTEKPRPHRPGDRTGAALLEIPVRIIFNIPALYNCLTGTVTVGRSQERIFEKEKC